MIIELLLCFHNCYMLSFYSERAWIVTIVSVNCSDDKTCRNLSKKLN